MKLSTSFDVRRQPCREAFSKLRRRRWAARSLAMMDQRATPAEEHLSRPGMAATRSMPACLEIDGQMLMALDRRRMQAMARCARSR